MSALAPAERAQVGTAADAAATQRLYERHAGRIFGYCLNWLGTREEAEDATQTTFLNAQRGLRRGVVPEFEVAWLYKIAQNVCRTRYDRARRRPDVARDIDALQDVLAAPERDEPDLLAELPDALARMPSAQRRALLLREWQGLSYREIADKMRVTEPAVETLLYRARRSLAANLEQPERGGRTSRLSLGSLVTLLKSLLTGGGAVKAAVAAVVVTATLAASGSTTSPARHVSVSRRAVATVPARAKESHPLRSVQATPKTTSVTRSTVIRPGSAGGSPAAGSSDAAPTAGDSPLQESSPTSALTPPDPTPPANVNVPVSSPVSVPTTSVPSPSLPVAPPTDVPSLPVQLPNVSLPPAPAPPSLP